MHKQGHSNQRIYFKVVAVPLHYSLGGFRGSSILG
jgi:hypothetical protein